MLNDNGNPAVAKLRKA
jgi:hypothetical protein